MCSKVLPVRRAERVFVLLGGAAFVASLAVCGWFYAVALGRPRASANPAAAFAVDALLFGAFALHHSVAAREPIKRALQRVVPTYLLRSVYVWIASALLVFVCAAWQPIGGELYRRAGAAAAPFLAVQLLGVWLTIRSVRLIDPLELAGLHHRRPDDALQIVGPYRLVRHPIYLGWVLMAFGTPHMTGDRLAFAVITTLYLAIAIPWEERGLIRVFGEDYRRYRRQVRWRMLPYVY
jgi:protein-S-isoprenylcysteine O-methyltransferase Ste14